MRKSSILIIFSVFIFLFILKANPVNAISCPNVPPGGDYTVSTNCTFAYPVDGVDNGNLIIASGYTLTINPGQTVVWNPGFSVIINGSIAISKTAPGGQLKKTYLWMTDADSDNYPATTTQYYGDNAPANGRRRYLMATTTATDCDDKSALVQVTRTQYIDADGDNYTVAGSSFCASASTWGDSACSTAGSNYAKNSAGSCILISSLSGSDCCDSDSRVNPGAGFQTSLGTWVCTAYPQWDFNCNGTVERQYSGTVVASCTVDDDCSDGSCSCLPTSNFEFVTTTCGASLTQCKGTCPCVKVDSTYLFPGCTKSVTQGCK